MDIKFREEISALHAQLCSGLADQNRILILYTLSDRPHHVTELSEALAMPQPTVSRHLKVLRERKLVEHKREGQAVIYSLADERVIQALDLLRAVLADALRSQGAIGETVHEQLTNTQE